MGQEGTALVSIAGLSAVFLFGVFFAFVSTFFNVALSACVLDIFEGKSSGIGGGVSTAAHRLKGIFGWSVITAIIGTIANVFDRQGGFLVKMLTFLGELAWRVATFFVIPIVASKNIGAVGAIKESVELMRKDWGTKDTTRRGSVKGFFILILVAVCILALTHINLGPQASTDLAIVLIPVFLVILLFFSTIFTIVRTALFYFPQSGLKPPTLVGKTFKRAPKALMNH